MVVRIWDSGWWCCSKVGVMDLGSGSGCMDLGLEF